MEASELDKDQEDTMVEWEANQPGPYRETCMAALKTLGGFLDQEHWLNCSCNDRLFNRILFMFLMVSLQVPDLLSRKKSLFVEFFVIPVQLESVPHDLDPHIYGTDSFSFMLHL
jgi:hypothetical protein